MRYLIFAIIFLLVSCAGGPDRQITKSIEASRKITAIQPSQPIGSKNKTIVRLEQPSTVHKSDKIEQQLYKAKIEFNLPYESNVTEVITAKLTAFPEALKNSESGTGAPAPRVREEINIARIVSAKLTAPDFHVDKLTPEEQAVAYNNPTTWQWRLKPMKSGKYIVNLSIMAVVKVDNQKFSEHHIKTFDQNLVITVTNKQLFVMWIEQYWQWLLSTLILPLVLWLFKKFNNKGSNH